MGLLVFGLFIVCCFLFPLPIKIAARRGHPDVNKIFFVVFFAGWTVVGWVTALIWSCLPIRGKEGTFGSTR